MLRQAAAALQSLTTGFDCPQLRILLILAHSKLGRRMWDEFLYMPQNEVALEKFVNSNGGGSELASPGPP